MVKTRHSEVSSEDIPEDFLTLKSNRRANPPGSIPRQRGFDKDSDTTSDEDYTPTTKHKFPANDESESDKEVKIKKVSSKMRASNRENLHEYELINGGAYCRRSSRTRRLLYDTLNMSTIDKHLMSLGMDQDVERPAKRERDVILGDHLEMNGELPADEDGTDRPQRLRKPSIRAREALESVPDNVPHHPCRGLEHEVQELQRYCGIEDVEQDMYSRVKRPRKRVARDMYGVPITEEALMRASALEYDSNDTSEEEADGGDEDDDDNEEDVDDDDNEEVTVSASKRGRNPYFLREKKPVTNFFQVPLSETYRRKKRHDSPPPLSRKTLSYNSPARKSSHRHHRKRHALNASSSTSCSDDSDDERKFERRKAKSMAIARNRLLPMNLRADDVSKNALLHDRVKIGSSLADIDPMDVDRTVTFDSVGGLGKHIRKLKEMIVFPLMYPEAFERYKITPPRGVLFHGPPGTGKTLVARALANECSVGDKRVAFFMRKGADCLSKWLGESERQLRLLFDQAYQLRPSIIFFDEIDGLAPVRSSRHEQIHSSIVSTLLALMDGLDCRGEIVVIGATNRIDTIDPALRRPGRFDREFLFPLPSEVARRSILHIHTKNWNPPLADWFVQEVAQKTVGYCGADLKALCTEAFLFALRGRYPQIYFSKEKLQLDVTSIQITAKNFFDAMQMIVPSSQRSNASPGHALSPVMAPLFQTSLQKVLKQLYLSFPVAVSQMNTIHVTDENAVIDLMDDDTDAHVNIYDGVSDMTTQNGPLLQPSFAKYSLTHQPRLLLTGHSGQGHCTHLAPAVLHQLEQIPVHRIDLSTLYGTSASTPEENCTQVFREARRTCPCILYTPRIDKWWSVLSDTLRASFLLMLADIGPSAPVLFFATTESDEDLPDEVYNLFDNERKEVVHITAPSAAERRAFFTNIFLVQVAQPPPRKTLAAKRALEALPIALPPEPKKLTESELKKLRQQEETTVRELRNFLRDVVNKLASDRTFQIFYKPVDINEVTDYAEVIDNPMDLQTMMEKIDLHQYETVKQFMDDIDLICKNALLYNPDRAPTDRKIRHRACALRDQAYSVMDAELNPEFEKACEEIAESRRRRGETPTKNAPNYYRVAPVRPSPVRQPLHPSQGNESMDDTPPTLEPINSENMIPPKPRRLLPRSPPLRPEEIKEANKRRANMLKKINIWCRPKRRLSKRRSLSPRYYIDRHMERIQHLTNNPRESQGDTTLTESSQGDSVRSEEKGEDDKQLNVRTSDNHSQMTKRELLPKEAECDKIAAETTESHTQRSEYNAHNTDNVPIDCDDVNKSMANKDPKESIFEPCTSSQANELSRVFRMTRAMVANPETLKALEILNQPVPPLVVDRNRLEELLDFTVNVTDGMNADTLERLHVILRQCIYEHRMNYNKTELTKDLAAKVKSFCTVTNR